MLVTHFLGMTVPARPAVPAGIRKNARQIQSHSDLPR
jgi:hypothetical protein